MRSITRLSEIFLFSIDPCYWRQKDGFYVEEGHGQTNECYPTLDKAKAKCVAAGDCKAIATQKNFCNGNFRVTHGGPTFINFTMFNWKFLDMTSYERICELTGNRFWKGLNFFAKLYV